MICGGRSPDDSVLSIIRYSLELGMGNWELGMVEQIPAGFVVIKPNNRRHYDDPQPSFKRNPVTIQLLRDDSLSQPAADSSLGEGAWTGPQKPPSLREVAREAGRKESTTEQLRLNTISGGFTLIYSVFNQRNPQDFHIHSPFSIFHSQLYRCCREG